MKEGLPMEIPLAQVIRYIETKQYRAAADLLMANGAVADRHQDTAMVAAMLGTCHLPLRDQGDQPAGTIRDLVIDRMITLRWLKPEAFARPSVPM